MLAIGGENRRVQRKRWIKPRRRTRTEKPLTMKALHFFKDKMFVHIL
jgi:hypothetical protein